MITLIGVSTAKPRKLFELFPKKFNLTTVALGSHLQKYKLKIQREFNLESFDQIQNWMVPQEHFKGNIAQAATQWKTPNFPGFTEEQIKSFMQSGYQ